MKQERKGFVIGKFYPFHKGHQTLIDFALQRCNFLSVLVCCSDKEKIEGSIRKNWITETFANTSNLEIRVLDYLEKELPNTSESSKVVSKIWSEILKQEYPDYDIIFSSEPYGAYVAEYMGIKHILFDNLRQQVPISATNIRQDLKSNWHYLPNSVKKYFAIKVVILGTESTGKSTLTDRLANYFDCNKVMEVGRELIPDSRDFDYSDLSLVAKEHAKQIEAGIIGETPLTIIDTDIHITLSYAQFCFGKTLVVEPEIYNTNEAHLYLYLSKEAPYHQDGTRLDNLERDALDNSHKKILNRHNITYIEISGDWEQRFKKAVSEIEQLLSLKSKELD